MIFLTVGTQFSFDRLVRAVDKAVGQNGFKETVFAQIGDSSYRPLNFEAVSSLEKRVFDNYMFKASGIISHAGIGTIMVALENNKPLLVIPRLKRYGEVVNDHQNVLARKFGELGHILVAYSEEELPEKLREFKTFVPKPRGNQVEVVANRIRGFLNSLCESHFG
jgi:UDP-N-acetylglucosamine transferase subunit ALG13